MANHKVKITPELITHLDYILPKLKFSVSYHKIIKWLENFEEEDLKPALDFLFFLEYIDFSELTFRIDCLLIEAMSKIHPSHCILIFPGVYEYPKSAEVINYLIKDTPTYKSNSSRITITRDQNIISKVRTYTSIIMVDDFIGSGGTFKDAYEKVSNLKSIMDGNIFIKSRHVLAALCLEEGKTFINTTYPEIIMHVETRQKLFNIPLPFLSPNSFHNMKKVAQKYGTKLMATPLGFGNGQALVAFGHTTPNNTLPIIWANKSWFPIYPRFAIDKIEYIKTIKSEAAYYIGIMNRLGIDLYSDENIKLETGRDIRYNTKEDHALLTLIKLQVEGYEMPVICQILGINSSEYKNIAKMGKDKGLIGHDSKINSSGRDFYRKLMRKSVYKRFIKKGKEKFEMKHANFVPKNFRGIA